MAARNLKTVSVVIFLLASPVLELSRDHQRAHPVTANTHVSPAQRLAQALCGPWKQGGKHAKRHRKQTAFGHFNITVCSKYAVNV